MAELDNLTLRMAIQAVQGQIRHFESLLTSQTLRDPEEIQSLILSCEKAAPLRRPFSSVQSTSITQHSVGFR